MKFNHNDKYQFRSPIELVIKMRHSIHG